MDIQVDWDILVQQLKTGIAILAALGIAVDLTPGIKIQPVRWLLAWIGRQLNRDMVTKIDELAKDLETHKVDSWRTDILDFANSCMNHRKHTKEEFDHIISVHDDYAKYIKRKKIVNGQVKLAYEYIEKQYRHCCENGGFLTIQNSEKGDDYDG